MTSKYPDDKRTRHGTPRDVPAAKWTCMNEASYSALQYGLAASLVCYVSDDDAILTREQFIGIVADRIADDLKYKTA